MVKGISKHFDATFIGGWHLLTINFMLSYFCFDASNTNNNKHMPIHI